MIKTKGELYMIKLIISGKFKIIIILSIILIKVAVAAQPLPMHSALGFSRTHVKAMKIIQDKDWSKQISQTKIELDTLMIKQLTDSNNKKIKANLTQREHPVLQLLKMNYADDFPIQNSLLYCSLEDYTSLGPRSRPEFQKPSQQPIEIQNAVTRQESAESEHFILDLETPHTLLISNTREISNLPSWLNEWNHLSFKLNQKDSDYDFQFRRFENGSILLGGNRSATNHKMYLFLSEMMPPTSMKAQTSEFESQRDEFLYPFELLKSTVKIRLRTDPAGPLTVKIVDIHQTPIRTLRFTDKNASGEQLVSFWDGYDDQGHEVPNGVYFYQVDTNQSHEISSELKLVVLR